MARDFNGSSDNLKLSSTILTSYPFTMAAWVNPDITTSAMAVMGVYESAGSPGDRWSIELRGDAAGDPVRFISRRLTNQVDASTTTGFVASVWQHVCAVGASATSRAVFLNGGSKGTNTTDSTPTAQDVTTIGVLDRNTDAFFFNGKIAEVIIWNIALSDAEVAIIARPGFPMNRYRSGNILAYWRIGVGSPEPDWSENVNNLTVSGTTIVDHPPIAPPFGFNIGWMGNQSPASEGTSIKDIIGGGFIMFPR